MSSFRSLTAASSRGRFPLRRRPNAARHCNSPASFINLMPRGSPSSPILLWPGRAFAAHRAASGGSRAYCPIIRPRPGAPLTRSGSIRPQALSRSRRGSRRRATILRPLTMAMPSSGLWRKVRRANPYLSQPMKKHSPRCRETLRAAIVAAWGAPDADPHVEHGAFSFVPCGLAR